METAVQYLKDRTEPFDDHFPCTRTAVGARACEKLAEAFHAPPSAWYVRLITHVKEVIGMA